MDNYKLLLIDSLLSNEYDFESVMNELNHSTRHRSLSAIGFPLVFINQLGQALNMATDTYLKPQARKDGYFRIQLTYKGNRRGVQLNRAILLAHRPIKGNPEAVGLDADHIEGKDNVLTNVRWLPSSVNRADKTRKFK
ncbi:hypothetical protein [Vibrio lentus]|uniref:hypothetical protein n=1 Tax=Vibrio lentus TaxID=136468 RepID=UPI0010BD56C0|nr:hypothetical protein [Vibrio lentus]TKG17754.1 hypothetical protein FCW05_12675 [Vibrio lentus]